MEEKEYWICFSVFPGIGPVRFKLLYDYFGSAKAAWLAKPNELLATGLGEKRTERFHSFRKAFDIKGYVRTLEKLHIHVITLRDSRYPKLLSAISDAPFLLYVLGRRGTTPIDMDQTIGVVGTRKITRYGTDVTATLVADLVTAGCTIVSGMAYGVDTVAHQTALDCGGQTIAVLGCGVDIIAPASNTKLYYDIVHSGRGAVISEMPLGLRPGKGLFPARNRIISGLSRGIVVTEGAEDSGALITARNAAEQGRDVFAVPGPITSLTSRGPAKLLKNGAKLVEGASDILDELGIRSRGTHRGTKPVRGETIEEQKVLDCIRTERKHIDQIVRETHLTMAIVAATLTILEMKGNVRDFGEKHYEINYR